VSPCASRARLDLGIGAGLRVPHYGHVVQQQPALDFFEIISENFMVDGGSPLYHLDRIVERYPVVQHGVSLDIGRPEPLDRGYLERLKKLTRRTRPKWVSDHFCWCGAGGAHLHDLLPLPLTAAMVDRISERARIVQDCLELPLLLENTSSYLAYRHSTLSEWDFIGEICERADIGLLLDVNNVFVSAFNHGFDAQQFIRSIPHERVQQIHLAGHTHYGTHIIDTHRGPIIDAVWQLYADTIALTGPVTTLIEWDDEIPEFSVLLAELERARAVRAAAVPRSERP
jgi:hypothetical protein